MTAVVYQVYPRSFAEVDNGGIGNLRGIRSRLEHLSWLGIDALWISPFFRSPMRDFGYDISDYCDVDPQFGDLDDFQELLDAAHAAGIRVLLDLVPNHTSDQHPWFVEARSSRLSPKRDWYVWRDGTPDKPPNNWVAAFTGGPAWTWDEGTQQWYLHMFLPEQPELNWSNPEVEAAMHDVMRFWLDRGVDGFRIDVVHGLGKDPDLPDDPPELAGVHHSSVNNHPSVHPILQRMRSMVDVYASRPVLIGEVHLPETSQVALYYGQNDQLHLAFNFPPLFAPWDATAWKDQIVLADAHFRPRQAWPTWVLSNHDNPRHRTRYGSEERARAAAVMLLTLRGTPILYAGEELGLENAWVPPERAVDPGGRDGCRAPLPWDATPTHGWSTPEPWLPWPPEPDVRNVETMRNDLGSMLQLYRRLIRIRRDSPALTLGEKQLLDSPDGVLAYSRTLDDDRRIVLINFTEASVEVSVDDEWTVELSSSGDELRRFDGRLGPDEAVLLAPAEESLS
jgi:alpha-glucosidase